MSDDPLLQAILDDPVDDAARLVYADWLEERGDPRAEFIRLQYERAALPPGDRRRAELEARESRLLAEHGFQWRAGIPLGVECRFRRGFVEEIELSVRAFLAWNTELFRRAPIRRARLRHEGPGDFPTDRLARCRNLRRLTSLDLSRPAEVYLPAAGVDVRALARSRHLDRLEALALDGQRIGDNGLRALAESPHLSRLKTLRVRECCIREAGAYALADSPLLPRLETLDLGHDRRERADPRPLSLWDADCNRIGLDGLQALIESDSTRLADLDLSGSQHHGEDHGLCFARYNVGYEGAIFLADSPAASRLRKLDLTLNELNRDSIEALAASPYLVDLTRLVVGERRCANLREIGPPIDYLMYRALQARFGSRLELLE
jgi:uncharacterized protein (TIGR02996 family)